jgi:hypothetical protein
MNECKNVECHDAMIEHIYEYENIARSYYKTFLVMRSDVIIIRRAKKEGSGE